MTLRSLTSLSLWLAFVTQGLAATTGSTSNSTCRCLSTDACWPSQAAFIALQSKLSQPLLAPQQLAKPCYTAPTSDECKIAQTSWNDGWWRANSSGGTQQPNFAAYIAPNGTIEACYLDTTLGQPCAQGSIPVVGVDVRNVQDAQIAVNFAATHNLRLVVKNTGHDYLGRSTARGAFLIWTHHLKNITWHDSFVPTGAPKSVAYKHAITLGSGVQWQEAYDTVFAHGREIVGGVSPGATVGAAGGWIQGGGHSILAPQHGLGVDNVMEMSIVTADGKYRIVNAYQDQDLFWALRGGGGGTWGVVVSVTYKTHRSAPILAAGLITSINASIPNATTTVSETTKKMVTEFVRVTPEMAESGWSGYANIAPSGDTGQLTLNVTYIAPASSPNAQSVMEKFYDFLRQIAAQATPEEGLLTLQLAAVKSLPSFAAWETEIFKGMSGQVGANTEIGSRLLPKDLLVNNYTAVANAVLNLNIQFTGFYIVAGGAVSKADPDSAALNPAWRKSLVHVVFSPDWPEGSSLAEINAQRDLVKRGEAAFRALTPGGGAYFNEASLYEVDFQHTFFGAHYPRLRAIKKQYDPASLFIVPEGVGSEDWDADLNCRV